MIYGSILAFIIPCAINLVTFTRTTKLLSQQAVLCFSNKKGGAGFGRSQSSRLVRRSRSRGVSDGADEARSMFTRHVSSKNATAASQHSSAATTARSVSEKTRATVWAQRPQHKSADQ